MLNKWKTVLTAKQIDAKSNKVYETKYKAKSPPKVRKQGGDQMLLESSVQLDLNIMPERVQQTSHAYQRN